MKMNCSISIPDSAEGNRPYPSDGLSRSHEGTHRRGCSGIRKSRARNGDNKLELGYIIVSKI